ncbi:MAG2960 family serine endopeptidase lipoprotein [Mycoplasma tauri]|uniref:DUF31 family protein n=1 Tax=Mycoplasma tauri TaxID=547987 RepID=A0A953NEB6_9MOLU|nr:DUF31 family protein [Mycoplasma tauri]MBZ4195363.1 DUF31 family protein [Mycoplasma tauri]MBZ4218265.1 DUF31 family protein [Mycoplasma tauri]
MKLKHYHLLPLATLIPLVASCNLSKKETESQKSNPSDSNISQQEGIKNETSKLTEKEEMRESDSKDRIDNKKTDSQSSKQTSKKDKDLANSKVDTQSPKKTDQKEKDPTNKEISQEKPENNNNNKPDIEKDNSTNEEDKLIEKIDKNQHFSGNKHFIPISQILKNTPYKVLQQTNDYKEALTNIDKYLRTGNHNNPIDFVNDIDQNKRDKFWEYTKNIGVYGNYGNNDTEKVDFFNPSISSNGMIKQKYLDEFSNDDIQGAQIINPDLSEVIKNNPFGFLPSNLSQLFYYASLDSISKLLKVKNIIDIKSQFDDTEGKFELLIKNNNHNKFHLSIDSKSNPELKKDDDFYRYIYDRSFMISINTFGWHWDPYSNDSKSGLKSNNGGGTMWVMDRIINPEAEAKGYWELLVATNIHVFGLRDTFDKSLYFNENISKRRESEWNAGFGYVNNANSERNLKYFMATRGGNTKLLNDQNYVKTQDNGSYYPAFSAYDQYLDAPYYTPRYYATGFYDSDAVAGAQNLEKYEQNPRIRSTKNAGADFVLLRLKIRKELLSTILPKLDEIIGTEQEKDWHIGVGKNELFNPIKTQFYGGYPVDVNEYFEPIYNKSPYFRFKYNKSTGGIINAQTRRIFKDNFQSLWVRYNKEENEDWNGYRDNYKKYEKPFIEGEHGMPKTVLAQHSQLYTYAPYDERFKLLGPGSSGSMAIDSSFNLIGINYLFTRDDHYKTYTNAISLMEGHSTYYDNFDGNLRTDIKNKLIKDNVTTVKINPKNN